MAIVQLRIVEDLCTLQELRFIAIGANESTKFKFLKYTWVKYSRLAVMDLYHGMVHTGGPALDDGLSVGTDEYCLGGGHEGGDYRDYRAR